MVGKVYAIEEHYIVIGSDVIYTGIVPEKLSCDVEVGDIVEIEYNMINSKTENKIKLISISKITSSLNHIDFIYDTMISLWEKEDKINENVNSVVLNLSELTNITNTEKSYIATKFSENYDVEVIEMFTNGSTLNEDALTDWFNSGLIIEVNLLEIKETGYLFNIRKYRTGYDDVVIENIEFLKPVEVETEVVEENLIEATNNNTGVPVMEAPVDEIPKNI